ncbi:MAG: prepilin peptidase [Burkholderiales bacterium]|nr:prepilin peptidase [Burkholderiales bacterium]
MTAWPAFVAGACLAALLLGAVSSDLRTRRIPNRLVLSGIALALAMAVLAAATGHAGLAGSQPWSPLAGLAAGFALMLPLHLLRAMGAGDVKLMAMVGAFTGPSTVLSATVYTLVAGGVLSLVFMLRPGVAAQALSNVRLLLTDWLQRAGAGRGLALSPLQATAARLPYAVAIACGTAAALAWPLSLPAATPPSAHAGAGAPAILAVLASSTTPPNRSQQ